MAKGKTRPPITLEKFLSAPTLTEWQREIDEHGWCGPDGSSCSLDDVQGIRIGITSPSYKHNGLPANRHDWHYQLGRRFKLPERFRVAADVAYRDGCSEMTAHLIGLSGWLARIQCRARYFILRHFGMGAWRE
jgi:hypothetical protein